MLSQADTAGGVVKLWRLQRGMDADVDALSEAKQARLGKLLTRTGDDGVEVVNALDQETLTDFLSVRRTATPDGGRKIEDLTRTVIVRKSSDLSDVEINRRVKRISETYEQLDTQRAKDELARAIEESGEDGIYLAEHVDGARLSELVDQGIDLKRHADGLGTYRRLDKTADDPGELTELFAQEKIIRPKFEGQESVDPPRNIDTTSVEISDSTGNQIGEVDGLTTNNGEVSHIIEVKKNPEKAVDAKEQMEITIDKIQDRGVGSGTSFRLDEKADFSSVTKDTDTMITIGPKDANEIDTPQSNYDYYVEFSQDELKALSDTIQSEGL